MKVLLVFMGLFLINVSFLVYQGDMNRYMQAQDFLKATAEECAAGAALYYDEEAFAFGRWIFNYGEGEKYIEGMLKRAEKRMPLPSGSTVSHEVSFEDDLKGYETEGVPTVQVTLTVQTKDWFRLPFLHRDRIMRKAKYELPEA